jgi:anti-repressor protein
MNELVLFKYQDKDINIVQGESGLLYFLARDVCGVLGYSKNVKNTVKRHCKPEGVMKRNTLTSGGNQELLYITERNVYRLIMRSKVDGAEKFQDWVEGEVLPTIRKTGSYALVPKTLPEALRAYALEIEKNETLQKKIAMDAPKISYADTVLNSPELVTTTQICKDYGMSARAFNQMLFTCGIQFKQSGQWQLYAKYHGSNYAHSATLEIRTKSGTFTKMYLKWTQAGRLFLYNTLKDMGVVPTMEKRRN